MTFLTRALYVGMQAVPCVNRNDRLDFFLGLVIRRFSDEMEKVRIGMTDSTFFICREVEVRIRSE